MATVLELIQTAKSDKDIRQLLTYGNNHRPSGKTRRGWLRAARHRRSELTVPFWSKALTKVVRFAARGRRQMMRTSTPIVLAQEEPKL